MTQFQGWIIIGLLALIAVSTTTFILQDLYYSLRAAQQKRAQASEELERRYQSQKDWERKHGASA